ncbi:MAG: winged helix-turn-helix domain-containing protein [Nitrososphaerales archaeon]
MFESYFAAVRMRRSVLELKIEILQAIADGASKQSHIIQKSNISWSMARNFVRRLEVQGLIETRRLKGRKSFVITERGKRVLCSYLSMIKGLELDVPPASGAPLPKLSA